MHCPTCKKKSLRVILMYEVGQNGHPVACGRCKLVFVMDNGVVAFDGDIPTEPMFRQMEKMSLRAAKSGIFDILDSLPALNDFEAASVP